MFWADKIVEKIKVDLKGAMDGGQSLIIRDEKTPSGRVHVGSMRGIAIHGIISEILEEQNIKNSFLYEFNDLDPMDGLPSYLDQAKYKEYMGMPLNRVPAPDLPASKAGGEAENYAEYFASEFINVIEEAGFSSKFYRASELYHSGKMNDAIKTALENAPEIRKIYKDVSGSVKSEDWMPLNVICENCGKIGTTKVTAFDGEKVTYTCEENLVEWAVGCTHSGTISPFDGNATLPFKVEWPAKFKVVEVNIEGAGKDHSTKGGARDVANHIAREIFDYTPPFDIPYEFFLVGGKKMSSSKGEGSSAKEISGILPPHIFRLALLAKNPKQTIDFIPDGDTIPVLFDRYDTIADKYFSGVEDDDARLFLLTHAPDVRKNIANVFRPRFSLIAFIVQMPHIDIEEEVARLKEAPLSDEDIKELRLRADYAQRWLQAYAPENYKYELQVDSIPEEAKNFSDEQKRLLKQVLEYVQSEDVLDGQELHTNIHKIRKASNVEPKDFFSALYLSFLGKESGPKAGWFLSVLDKEFLEKRLEEVIQ